MGELRFVEVDAASRRLVLEDEDGARHHVAVDDALVEAVTAPTPAPRPPAAPSAGHAAVPALELPGLDLAGAAPAEPAEPTSRAEPEASTAASEMPAVASPGEAVPAPDEVLVDEPPSGAIGAEPVRPPAVVNPPGTRTSSPAAGPSSSDASGLPVAPREVQRRVRSGESLETIAADVGTTVERLRPFALPVLAEREHVANTARSCAVSERGTLEQVVGGALEAAGMNPTDEWDALVGADGRWRTVVSLPDGAPAPRARFRVDLGSRLVQADDEVAAWLLGEGPRPPRPGGPPRRPAKAVAAGEAEGPAPKLKRASIPSWDEIMLGSQRDEGR